jgi:putative endonuclease
MNKAYYVYILASDRNGTLYIGVTSNLKRRVDEHKRGVTGGFTSKYNANILVYYEMTNSIDLAIQREKTLKKWNRRWKIDLVEKANPDWKDLFEDFILDSR